MFEILFCLYMTPYRIFKGTPQELADLCDLTLDETSKGLQRLVEENWVTVEMVGKETMRIGFVKEKETRILKLRCEATAHLIQLIREK